MPIPTYEHIEIRTKGNNSGKLGKDKIIGGIKKYVNNIAFGTHSLDALLAKLWRKHNRTLKRKENTFNIKEIVFICNGCERSSTIKFNTEYKCSFCGEPNYLQVVTVRFKDGTKINNY